MARGGEQPRCNIILKKGKHEKENIILRLYQAT